MKVRYTAAAGLAAVAMALAGCSGSDKAGCGVLQDSLKETYTLADRWQYGNAPNADMLNQLQDLRDTAAGQMAIAKSGEFKGLAGTVRDAAARMYTAVNTGTGESTASAALLSVGDDFQTVCGPLMS